MLDFIMQYWLQVLLGLISTGLGFLARKFWSLYKSEQKHQKTKEQEEFCQELKEAIAEQGEQSHQGDKILQEQIDAMKSGLLTVQRKIFMEECHALLDENHDITLEEFEEIGADYAAYKQLGGNGQGKVLYEMIKQKSVHNITE